MSLSKSYNSAEKLKRSKKGKMPKNPKLLQRLEQEVLQLAITHRSSQPQGWRP